jgi:NAD(P)-dependent dehydrogenase (short-subunit alcohol dehydrogenase family)
MSRAAPAVAAEQLPVHLVELDVTSAASVAAAFATIVVDGPVDVLVNNAGITADGTFRRMTFERWHKVIDTNLNSLFHVTKQVIDGMLDRGWGRVINISSVNGQRGQFGQTNYSTAKAGIHGFTMALAQEVASKGVTVNTVSPGYIGTEMPTQLGPMMRRQCGRALSSIACLISGVSPAVMTTAARVPLRPSSPIMPGNVSGGVAITARSGMCGSSSILAKHARSRTVFLLALTREISPEKPPLKIFSVTLQPTEPALSLAPIMASERGRNAYSRFLTVIAHAGEPRDLPNCYLY